MTRLLALVLFATPLVACGPTDRSDTNKASPTQAPIAQASAPSLPPVLPRFEIRDLKFDEEKQPYIGTAVKGRGTLVAIDDAQRKGNLVVWLSAKEEHSNDRPVQKMVLLRDGVGTVETYDYLAANEKGKKIRYHDWQVVGFAPLEKATLVAEQAK